MIDAEIVVIGGDANDIPNALPQPIHSSIPTLVRA
jgi:hypothetical protein